MTSVRDASYGNSAGSFEKRDRDFTLAREMMDGTDSVLAFALAWRRVRLVVELPALLLQAVDGVDLVLVAALHGLDPLRLGVQIGGLLLHLAGLLGLACRRAAAARGALEQRRLVLLAGRERAGQEEGGKRQEGKDRSALHGRLLSPGAAESRRAGATSRGPSSHEPGENCGDSVTARGGATPFAPERKAAPVFRGPPGELRSGCGLATGR